MKEPREEKFLHKTAKKGKARNWAKKPNKKKAAAAKAAAAIKGIEFVKGEPLRTVQEEVPPASYEYQAEFFVSNDEKKGREIGLAWCYISNDNSVSLRERETSEASQSNSQEEDS